MKNEADNEQLLTRHLLGILPEEQRPQVEGEFFNDDQRYEQLVALEDELFYDYAQNKLSPREREQFENRYLSSEQNHKRTVLYSDVANKIDEGLRNAKELTASEDRSPAL